jgi:hypothetical protein
MYYINGFYKFWSSEPNGRTLEERFREAARFFGKLNIPLNSGEVISIIKRKTEEGK